MDSEPGMDRVASLWRFSVADTGIGIPIDRQAAIFQAFTQAENSTTRRFGGTGLGLTISARLVEAMSGRMWVESEAGRGTTFHFTALLPLAADAPTPSSAAVRNLEDTATMTRPLNGRPQADAELNGGPPLDGIGGPLRILLVEDNPVNQKVAAIVLRKRGHQVTIACNGQEGLNAAARDAFDVVLMDVQMPVMDGLQATAAIRARERLSGAHLPIIAMTAHALKEDVDRCLAAGMDGYVSKPFRIEALMEELCRVLNKQTVI